MKPYMTIQRHQQQQQQLEQQKQQQHASMAAAGPDYGGIPFLVFLALVCAGAILLLIALSCVILYNIDASVQKQM